MRIIALRSAFLAAVLTSSMTAQSPLLRFELSPIMRAMRTAKGETRALRVEQINIPNARDGTASFPADDSCIDIGPDAGLGISSKESFSVHMSLRTNRGVFCTPLMCREGNAVNYSFVMGRRAGTVSFEMWNWPVDRAISTSRVDDGKWHEIVGAFDAASQHMGVFVDGKLEAMVPVTGRDYRPSPRPMLRLGNNIGAHQPFTGALSSVRIDRGIPDAMRTAIARRQQFQILPRGRANLMFEEWLVAKRKPRPPESTGRSDWIAKAASTRVRLQSALGLMPPPYPPADYRADGRATDFSTYRPTLPLSVRKGGHLRREGYTVTRIYWQTIRDSYASGYLYEPTGPAEENSRPAVLCPHGHFRDGARHPVIQSRCITLAKNGYVVLTVDSVHVTDDPIGLSPLSSMTWNNIRGLELLRGLPSVDGTRIGCTGASGGGQQTFYLTGLKTGLAAVVPAVMVCYFEEILLSSGVHCRCNFTPGVMSFADEPLLSACFAPKPQLFLSVTGDWTKNFPKKGFPEVRSIYGHFDASDVVRSLQWESPHDYNRDMRNAMYAFFGRHLKGEAAPARALEPKGLRTESRNALIALDRKDVPRDLAAVAREFRARLTTQWSPSKVEQRRAALLERFGGPLPRQARTTPRRTMTWRGYRATLNLVSSTVGISLPAVSLRPGSSPVQRATLLVTPEGKGQALDRHAEFIVALLEAGHAVDLVDIRYSGELDGARTWREPYGKIFGRDPGVVGAVDIAFALRALGGRYDLRPQNIALVALGRFGAPALYSAALYGNCGKIVLTDLGPTYERSDRRPKLAGILRVGDLPVAAALLPESTRLLAGGCADPKDYRKARNQRLFAKVLRLADALPALR